MADMSTAGASATPVVPEGAAKPEGQQGSDVLEIILDGMDKPTKIPLDKVNPGLAKFRSDADRKFSEADKVRKDFEGRDTRIKSQIAAAKSDPDRFDDLAKELGLTPEELDTLSERRVSRMLEKQMRDAEEEKNPAARATREQAEEAKRLKQENEELKGKETTRAEAEKIQRAEGMVVQVLDKMGPSARDPQAAQHVVWTLRTMVNEKEAELGRPLANITELGDAASPAALAKATRESWGQSSAKYFEVHPDAEIPESVLKRAEAIIDKRRADRPAHPASGKGGTGGAARRNGNDLKEGEAPAASKTLLKYLKL